jgi:hypothetical protein
MLTPVIILNRQQGPPFTANSTICDIHCDEPTGFLGASERSGFWGQADALTTRANYATYPRKEEGLL